MTRYTPGSKPEAIATGLRGCNGTGVSPDGSIVFAMPQEGSWQPASGIFEVGDGSYHGFFGPKPEFGKHGYRMPLCFLPRGIDNSSGDVIFAPHDERFGPLAGKMIGTSLARALPSPSLEMMGMSAGRSGALPRISFRCHRGSFSQMTDISTCGNRRLAKLCPGKWKPRTDSLDRGQDGSFRVG